MFGPLPSGHSMVRSTHQLYSASDSPFHAKTGMPAFAIAAAAWSCVLKMLHDDQRTCAPSLISVSISTAVWIVMCRQPAMRAPLSGCCLPYLARRDIRPGISFSASMISLRPHSARPRSLTLKSSACADLVVLAGLAWAVRVVTCLSSGVVVGWAKRAVSAARGGLSSGRRAGAAAADQEQGQLDAAARGVLDHVGVVEHLVAHVGQAGRAEGGLQRRRVEPEPGVGHLGVH